MNGFNLSPGITPLLTDLFVLEVPLALGFAYLWRGGRGFEFALALNAMALGLVKLVTDYRDIGDLPVAINGIVGGALLGLEAVKRPVWDRLESNGLLVFGTLVALIGVGKAAFDFYDPFDLLLADLLMVVGVLLGAAALAGRRGRFPDRHASSPN